MLGYNVEISGIIFGLWSRCECIEIGIESADFNEKLNSRVYLLLKIVSSICVKINIGNCADYT